MRRLDRRSLLAAGLAALATPARSQAGDYRQALSRAYGGDVDPRRAHAQAASAAKILQVRADRLLRDQGLIAGPVGERLARLSRDPRWLYSDDDAGRDKAVSEMNARLAAFRPRLAAAFGDLAIPSGEVRRMSPADATRGRAGYREGAGYYVDLRDIRARPAWTLPSVVFHELIPGHLLEPAASPPRIPAWPEAWPTYAEELACDLGAYEADPLGELGYLQWRLFRLGRAVADTGLHVFGWSREQAIAAMTALQGQSIAFISIETDVGRMIDSPGKVAAEALGALALRRQRPRDRTAWPAYHRAVLHNQGWRTG